MKQYSVNLQKEETMPALTETSTMVKRELKAYFASPIAYIVMTAFLVPLGAFFFWDFFYVNQAEMRKLFEILPLLFTFFIPAITMRLFSEERRSGSLEVLLTLPVTTAQVVAAKFISAFLFVVLMLVPTLVYVITIILVGSPEPGPLVGGYLGLLFLAAGYIGIGLLASALSKNQIVAFIATWVITFLLWLVDKVLIFLPGPLRAVQYLGADFHFDSIARGIVDSRDIVYFLSVVAITFILTIKAVEERR